MRYDFRRQTLVFSRCASDTGETIRNSLSALGFNTLLLDAECDKPNELLLSPINPSDLHMVRERYGFQPELPASPGAEGVGIVESVGPGVQGPTVGTRVVFVRTWNTWRELGNVSDAVCKKAQPMTTAG